MDGKQGSGGRIAFTKMAGHGNDFIMIDGTDGLPDRDWSAFAVDVCRRRQSVGADGVIVIAPSERADFTMRIVNADGSEAEMCGNGARCAALFAVRKGIVGTPMHFETQAGIIEACVKGSHAAVKLTDPAEFDPHITISACGRRYEVVHVNTGVPHTIVFTERLKDTPVESVGRDIRNHPRFEPAGTNVDFVASAGPHRVAVRTYERGVEAETMACGTGAVAAAVASVLTGRCGGPPVKVEMPGGTLSVSFVVSGKACRDVWLSGPVVTVYTGEIYEEELSE